MKPFTQTQLNHLARLPSSRAPSLRELQEPPPPHGNSLAELLDRWSARDVVWEAGVPVAMSLSGRAFLAGGAELLHAAPIRSVRLVAIAPFLAELAACPHLARLERLDLTGNWIGDTGLTLLVESPYLAELRELVLIRNGLSEVAVAKLRERFPRMSFVTEPAVT